MLRRALQILREDGLLVLGFRVLGETVYRRMLVVEGDVTNPVNQPDSRCRWLTPADADVYARYHLEVSADEVRRRLAEGQRCYVLWTSDHRIASGMWVAFGRVRIDYLQTDLVLDPVEAYLFQSFTPPEHRGRGLSTTVVRAVRAALREEGYRRTIGCIQPDKFLAYAPLYRSATTARGYFGWIGLGPWRWVFRRSTNRYPWYAPRPASMS